MILPCKLVPDITVGPVGAAELDHQPQLINFPHRGKYRHQLILKAVPNEQLNLDTSYVFKSQNLGIL